MSAPAEPSGHSDLDAPEVIDGEHAEPAVSQGGRLVWSQSFRGPLPPPQVLAEYDQAVPGLAREIVDQWKLETAHRHKTIDGMRELDREAMNAYYAAERRGQILALFVFLAVVGVVALAIVLGSPEIGIPAIVIGGGSAIWAMRRRSDGPSSPVDLADGDAIEKVEPLEPSDENP